MTACALCSYNELNGALIKPMPTLPIEVHTWYALY